MQRTLGQLEILRSLHVCTNEVLIRNYKNILRNCRILYVVTYKHSVIQGTRLNLNYKLARKLGVTPIKLQGLNNLKLQQNLSNFSNL